MAKAKNKQKVEIVKVERVDEVELSKKHISVIEDKIHSHINIIKISYIAIGKLLHEAKEVLGHGEFKKWVEKRFKSELPYSTANLYKNTYDQYEQLLEGGKDAEIVHNVMNSLPASFLVHMTQKRFPDGVKQVIYKATADYQKANDTNKVIKFNTNRVINDFGDFKAKRIDLNEFEKRTEAHMQTGIKYMGSDKKKLRMDKNLSRLTAEIKKIRQSSAMALYHFSSFVQTAEHHPDPAVVESIEEEIQGARNGLNRLAAYMKKTEH